MSADDEGPAVSYLLLARGTQVVSADGLPVGTVDRVQDNEREHIFDGIVVATPEGRRFVDAPEVARIAERRVTLTLTAAEASRLLQPPVERRLPRGPSRRLRRLGGR